MRIKDKTQSINYRDSNVAADAAEHAKRNKHIKDKALAGAATEPDFEARESAKRALRKGTK